MSTRGFSGASDDELDVFVSVIGMVLRAGQHEAVVEAPLCNRVRVSLPRIGGVAATPLFFVPVRALDFPGITHSRAPRGEATRGFYIPATCRRIGRLRPLDDHGATLPYGASGGSRG